MKAFSVYGGPGCGKSTEILRRVQKLVSSGVSPERIALVSFTRAAAEEAMSRSHGSCSASTIHSLCLKKIRAGKASVVSDAKLAKFFDEMGIEYTRDSLDIDDVFSGVGAAGNEYLAVLSLARSRGEDPYAVYDSVGQIGTMAEFDVFVKTYSKWKAAYGYIDFCDMLEGVIRSKVGIDYYAVFIDEAQDLSNLQWAAMMSMIKNGAVQEVHISGDDDQAIYTWNGANPHGMVEFEEIYGADRMVLPKSYRLPRRVYSVARRVISKATKRVDKDFSCRDDDGEVHTYSFLPDEIRPNSLVLARANMLVLKIERELIERRVPYVRIGSRGGGAWHTTVARALRVHKKFNNGESVSEAEVAAFARVASTRYRDDLLSGGDVRGVLSKPWQDTIVCSDRMVGFYENVYDRLDDEITIRIGTIHASKGAEADNVYLVTDTTSRVMMAQQDDPDDEIRVRYVGVTRARRSLYLIGEGDDW